MSVSSFKRPLVLLAFTALLPGAASADPLTAQQTLQQFNLVVFGNVTSTSDVEGRSWIGGSLSGGNDVQRPLPASSYAGLTVLGHASGLNVDNGGVAIGGNLSNTNVNNGGGVVFGNSTNVNFNGGTPSYVQGTRSGGNANSGIAATASANPTLQSYANAMTSTDFAAVMGQASDRIAALAANSSISIVGSKATFNATPNASGVAVFDLVNSASFFSSVTEFSFNLGGATSVFINSDFAGGTLNDNFLGGSAALIAPTVIWNFSDATQLTFMSQWGGTVLATDAAVTTYNNIEARWWPPACSSTARCTSSRTPAWCRPRRCPSRRPGR